MSNNAPDYENNLVFPPQEIKSQDDIKQEGRQSDVLIKAIEKCEKLDKEIIALNKEYQAECNRADELEDSLQTSWQNESKLKKLLRECRYKIIADLDNARICESSVDIEDFEYLIKRIDNAIGEKQ